MIDPSYELALAIAGRLLNKIVYQGRTVPVHRVRYPLGAEFPLILISDQRITNTEISKDCITTNTELIIEVLSSAPNGGTGNTNDMISTLVLTEVMSMIQSEYPVLGSGLSIVEMSFVSINTLTETTGISTIDRKLITLDVMIDQ